MEVLPKHPLVLAAWLQDQRKKMTPKTLEAVSGLAPRTIKKYLWLASIPEDIKNIMLQSPEIFTTHLLVNTFASRQKFFQKENWKYLKQETSKCLQNGPLYKPRKALCYPRGRAGGSLRQQRKRQQQKRGDLANRDISVQTDPVNFMEELDAQERLRERLATWVEVANGEVRIKYHGSEDLRRLIELIEGQSDILKA